MIIKLFRIVFFLCFYFYLCLIIVDVVLSDWSIETHGLFALAIASILTGLGERRRARKAVQKNTLKQVSQKSQFRKSETIHKRAQRVGWIPSSETARIAGRDIGGMVYVGVAPRSKNYGYGIQCRAYINPALSVARHGTDKAGKGMPYWPGYSQISPQSRASYLEWLGSGRCDSSYNPGYMFLYFYGLERRFILEKPSETERREILVEVRRLKSLYPENGSVQRYLGEFIHAAQVVLDDVALHEPIFDFRGWELPLSLKVAIGLRVGRGDLLSSDWVLSWLLCHPERQLRTPANRCFDEFKALFKLRFDEQFPKGLKVRKPRKMLESIYRAASGEFKADIGIMVNESKIPDISGLYKPIEVAQEIADGVMDDLDKLSRYLGRNPNGRESIEAQALLPQELWALFPSKELNSLKSWASTIITDGGMVPVAEVIERLEGKRPEKLSKRSLTNTADVLARIGFGFAPDPRFALRSPKINEPIVLFDLGKIVTHLEDVSSAYRSVLVELAFSSFMAHADGKITHSERELLLAKIYSIPDLSEQERRRLVANIEWMLVVVPDIALLRRKLRDTGPEERATIRSALIAMVHADGIIQPEEVTEIEKIYKVLGLSQTLVYSDLHAGNTSYGPISVRGVVPEAAGEVIPAERLTTEVKLDAARIAYIQSDTERVSAVLGEIFDETPEDFESPSTLLTGLDEKHTALVRALIDQKQWSEEEFQALCSHLGLFVSGAMEVINEWAFEVYNEAILEEYDGYEVLPNIAEALREKFEGEERDV